MDPLYYRAAQRQRSTAELGPLFEPLPPAVHGNGLPTEREADARNAPHKARLRDRVVAAIRAHPDITDKELEDLPEFADIKAKNTIRRRRTDAYQARELVVTGIKRIGKSRFTTWRVAP